MILKGVRSYLFGAYCPTHRRHYRSDLCPECNGHRWKTMARSDKCGDRTKSTGSWPLRSRSS
jgi:hypothetical protein